MVLNGRAVSDRVGAPTCRHLQRNTVLDLAIVADSADADMKVLPPLKADGHYHTAVWAAVSTHPRPAPAHTSAPSLEDRPASYALTAE